MINNLFLSKALEGFGNVRYLSCAQIWISLPFASFLSLAVSFDAHSLVLISNIQVYLVFAFIIIIFTKTFQPSSFRQVLRAILKIDLVKNGSICMFCVAQNIRTEMRNQPENTSTLLEISSFSQPSAFFVFVFYQSALTSQNLERTSVPGTL